MAVVTEEREGSWWIRLDGEVVGAHSARLPLPLGPAIHAHAVDRERAVRIETVDGVVMELDFLSFGRFHQPGDPQRG